MLVWTWANLTSSKGRDKKRIVFISCLKKLMTQIETSKLIHTGFFKTSLLALNATCSSPRSIQLCLL